MKTARHTHPHSLHMYLTCTYIFTHQTERLLDWQTTLYRQCSLHPISVVTIDADGNCVSARQQYRAPIPRLMHAHTNAAYGDTRHTDTHTHAGDQWNLTSERKKGKIRKEFNVWSVQRGTWIIHKYIQIRAATVRLRRPRFSHFSENSSLNKNSLVIFNSFTIWLESFLFSFVVRRFVHRMVMVFGSRCRRRRRALHSSHPQ